MLEGTEYGLEQCLACRQPATATAIAAAGATTTTGKATTMSVAHHKGKAKATRGRRIATSKSSQDIVSCPSAAGLVAKSLCHTNRSYPFGPARPNLHDIRTKGGGDCVQCRTAGKKEARTRLLDMHTERWVVKNIFFEGLDLIRSTSLWSK